MLARVNGSLMIDGKPEGLLALEKVTVPLWSAGGTDRLLSKTPVSLSDGTIIDIIGHLRQSQALTIRKRPGGAFRGRWCLQAR